METYACKEIVIPLSNVSRLINDRLEDALRRRMYSTKSLSRSIMASGATVNASARPNYPSKSDENSEDNGFQDLNSIKQQRSSDIRVVNTKIVVLNLMIFQMFLELVNVKPLYF